METLRAYLDRKHEEISLLNGCLRRPLALPPANSVPAIVNQKFQLAAALKAQHALDHWASTETAWAEQTEFCSGPFHFRYGYQRADLTVSGPPIYAAPAALPPRVLQRTIYANSGMAAIAAMLSALERLRTPVEMVALPGSYGETLELIEDHARNVKLLPAGKLPALRSNPESLRILWLDCCATAARFRQVLSFSARSFDLVLFDTTGLWTGSGRVQRVLNWAFTELVPVILLRSHTKLDSLGVEYGRLGSAVLLGDRAWRIGDRTALEDLAQHAADALRLFGGAAIPAHFPPFVGSRAYVSLNGRRISAMLRNSRRTAARLMPALPGAREFTHRLYVALAPGRALTEQQAKDLAGAMCRDLGDIGLPLRHAGSFGFDFAAAEWFHDTARDRHVVRVAVPDLPTEQWDTIVTEIIRWWNENAGAASFRMRERRESVSRPAAARLWHMAANATM
jgi:hypothetical protein